jgi:hypothetical protein
MMLNLDVRNRISLDLQCDMRFEQFSVHLSELPYCCYDLSESKVSDP